MHIFLGVNSQDIDSGTKARSIQYGKCLSNTTVRFVVGSNSSLMLVGKAKRYVLIFYKLFSMSIYFILYVFNISFKICSQQTRISIINPDFDFNKMGIGGLDNEFNAIFRRAFASRVFPQEIIEQLGTI